MFKLKSLTSGEMALYKDDLQLVILPDRSHISIEFIIDQKHYQKTYKVLETFLQEIKHTKDFSVLEINLKTSTETFVVSYEGSDVTDIFSVVLEAPYTKDMYVHLQGLSDYKYVYDYMPQWSTAFKNIYSNHTQAFEPLFTNSLNIDYNVDNLIKNRPIQNLKNILFYRKDPIIENISEKSLDYFIKEKEYIINSEDTVNFGKYNTIYIKLKTPGNYKLRIKGIYNSAYIKEDILIYGEGIFTLNLKYSHIYSINMIEFYSENNENSVLLSNVYEIKDFNFQNKDNRSLEYSANKVISTSENDKNVFINKLPYYDGMFIDNQDNVIVDYNNKLYTAKLNSKLNLNIPKDVTYNNTKYLETTYLSPTEYEISVSVKDFAIDFDNARMCIFITDSKNKTFYLNNDFELEESLTDIYVDGNRLKDKIHFNIELDSDVEYVIISIKDNSGIYKKSNLIVQPFIEFVPNLYILPTEELLLIEDKFYLLDTSEFKLTPLLLNPTQTSLKDSVNYHYYYMTSETYPLTPEPDFVRSSVSEFDISILSTKSTYDLPTEKFSGGIGNTLFTADIKIVIDYSTILLNKDVTYNKGITNFTLENKPVIVYKTYGTEADFYANIGVKGFSTTLKRFTIINEDLYNKINIAVSSFEITLEE